jgi:hypothetical protein
VSVDLRNTTFHALLAMSRFRLATRLVPVIAMWLGCGGSAVYGSDPQAPHPADPKLAASAVVICPEGSTYDPQRNACIATSAVTPLVESTKSPHDRGGSSSVRVRFNSPNDSIAVLPERFHPDDDGFLMQALIGFAEEPDLSIGGPSGRVWRAMRGGCWGGRARGGGLRAGMGRCRKMVGGGKIGLRGEGQHARLRRPFGS